MIYSRSFSRALMYSMLSLLCVSDAIYSMSSQKNTEEDTYLLLQQKAKNFWNAHKKSVGIGAVCVASLGMSLLTLEVTLDYFKQYNQQCSSFDSSSFETDCNASMDYDMSSDQEYTCYCNSLAQRAFLGVVASGAMIFGSIGFPLSMWLPDKCKKSTDEESRGSIPTASSLVKRQKHNGEDHV